VIDEISAIEHVLSWQPEVNLTDIAGFNIYVNGSYFSTESNNTFLIPNGSSFDSIILQVTSFSADGQFSPLSNPIEFVREPIRQAHTRPIKLLRGYYQISLSLLPGLQPLTM